MIKRPPFICSLLTESEICKAMGERIRNVRQRKKLTLKELSERSKVRVSVITKAETRGDLTLRNLIKLGAALNYDTTEGLELMFRAPQFSSLDEYLEYHAGGQGS